MSYGVTTIKPLVVTDAQLLETSLLEDDYAEFDPEETYAAEARCIDAATHSVFESKQDGNINHAPTLVTSAAWWDRVGPTNPWACLDLRNSTATRMATSGYYRFQPSAPSNGLFLLGLENVTQARVRQIHSTLGTIYDKTWRTTPLPMSSGWHSWTFQERRVRRNVVAMDLFPFPDVGGGAEIRVDLTGGDNMRIGTLAYGYRKTFGMGVKMGVPLSMTDFSVKKQNQYGEEDFIQRGYSDEIQYPMLIENRYLDPICNHLTSLRSQPLLVVGARRFQATTVFGWIDDFRIVIPYTDHSDCTLTVKGLVT